MAMMDITVRGNKYPMNDNLFYNCETIKELIALNFDGVIVLDGMEGSGKSELGKQICINHNNNFSAKDVFYTAEQFNEWLETAKPGSAGLWDEFVLVGLSTEALTKVQNLIVKQFTLIRKKRLLIVLIIPYIFMLKRYFAIARTRALIHTYCKGTKRGYFKFYDYKLKQWIYNYGYKTWFYNEKVNPNFKGMFGVWTEDLIDEEEIQRKKDEAIKSIGDKKDLPTLTKKQAEGLAWCENPYTKMEDQKNWDNFRTIQNKCRELYPAKVTPSIPSVKIQQRIALENGEK